MKYHFSIFFASMVLILLFGCDHSSSSIKKLNPEMPVLSEQNTNRHGCLNIQAFQSLFHSNFPSLEVTTDFKPDVQMAQNKILFHTHAAFDVKKSVTANIELLNRPIQIDCQSVRASTASGETLEYKITEGTTSSIFLEIENFKDFQKQNYRIKNLAEKLHPIQYEIKIIDEKHFRVSITYKSFDAHCRDQNIFTSKIQKDFYWAASKEEWPDLIEISRSFYKNYLSTIAVDEVVNSGDDYISISLIKLIDLESRELTEDLSKCVL